ncbi:hypothetical protein [Cellulomonas alba]|uniref:Lipoprotein n=1 Tax=Cellulomonas alba TaxID=3053467 RepID=A0ABT7SGC4_9CELL|nr:hypothetical protein [Cellulomonas alba]MDM7855230.1 hypothetical protein [Cellulomonas alba]
MRGRVLTAGLLVGVVVGCAGCSGEPRHVGVPVTALPTTLDDCNHISVHGDPGLGAGFHYDEAARHPFGSSARLVVCLPGAPTSGDGEWRFHTASDAVSVVQNGGDPGDGIISLTITVSRAADGTSAEMTGGFGSFGAPTISTDDHEWWFGPWGDDAGR